MKILVIDQENNAEAWWTAAGKAKNAPPVFAKLRATASGSGRLTVSDKDAAKFVSWASALPGWEDGPAFAQNPVNVHDAE